METEKQEFDEEKFTKFLEFQFTRCMEQGVIKGFKAALDKIVEDIDSDSNLTIEQLRDKITKRAKITQTIEDVNYSD